MMLKYIQVTNVMHDAIMQSSKLITQQYGRGSPYSEWIVDGFKPYAYDYILGQINNPMRSLWVALAGTKVVATIVIQKLDTKTVVFHKFARDPEFKQERIGARLLAFAERQVKKQGFKKIRIEVFSAASRLVNYYIKKSYNQAIMLTPLAESQTIKYTAPGAAYGFLMLEKTL
jgi:ribosomal protein S18 acetylase RimI-like enzyme